MRHIITAITLLLLDSPAQALCLPQEDSRDFVECLEDERREQEQEDRLDEQERRERRRELREQQRELEDSYEDDYDY